MSAESASEVRQRSGAAGRRDGEASAEPPEGEEAHGEEGEGEGGAAKRRGRWRLAWLSLPAALCLELVFKYLAWTYRAEALAHVAGG